MALANHSLLPQLIHSLSDPDPGVRMRISDALANAAAARPEIIAPHRNELLAIAKSASQQEVHWHLAEILPKLTLDPRERDVAWGILRHWLEQDASRIIQATCLQALCELALGNRQDGPRPWS